MNYFESIKYGFKNIFNFRGVTNKQDYWRFANLLFSALFVLALAVPQIFRYFPNDLGLFSIFFYFGAISYLPFAVFIAVILLSAATTRRLRDAGFSPKLQFLHFLPIAPLGFLGYFSVTNQVGWMLPTIALAALLAIGVLTTLHILTNRPSKSPEVS